MFEEDLLKFDFSFLREVVLFSCLLLIVEFDLLELNSKIERVLDGLYFLLDEFDVKFERLIFVLLLFTLAFRLLLVTLLFLIEPEFKLLLMLFRCP